MLLDLQIGRVVVGKNNEFITRPYGGLFGDWNQDFNQPVRLFLPANKSLSEYLTVFG